MSQAIDYFFTPNSPWTYLGHARFVAMARSADAIVQVRPVNMGKVFSVSGGLPLGKRAPQRQAYRLVELDRFGAYLGLPLHVQPRFFPVAADDAARLIIAADLSEGVPAALHLTGALLAAVWAQERDIANADVLARLLEESGLPPVLLERSRESAVLRRYEDYTRNAIDAGIFGAPTYCVAGEMFWGQDRLDFLERRLRAA